MRIYYSEAGEVIIEKESMEDDIIWKHLINVDDTIIFNRTANHSIFKSVINEPRYIMVGLIKVSIPSGVSLSELKIYKSENTKLGAVKYIKNMTGLGLKECKEWIDEVWDYILQ